MNHSWVEELVDRGRYGTIVRYTCSNKGCNKRKKPEFVRSLSTKCKGVRVEKPVRFGIQESRVPVAEIPAIYA